LNQRQKSFFQLRQISKIKPVLTWQDLEKVIHAFIATRLGYCSTLYVEVSQATLSRLQLDQSTAAHLLTGEHRREHISSVLSALHLLPVHYRIGFEIFLIVDKCLNGLIHPVALTCFSDMFPLGPERSVDHLTLVVPKTKLKLSGDQAFAIIAPKLWNKLPLDVRRAPFSPCF